MMEILNAVYSLIIGCKIMKLSVAQFTVFSILGCITKTTLGSGLMGNRLMRASLCSGQTKKQCSLAYLTIAQLLIFQKILLGK